MPQRPRQRPLRVLQVADTHFHGGDGTTERTDACLRAIVERDRPLTYLPEVTIREGDEVVSMETVARDGR